MCGICGFTWEDKKLLKAMTDIISHRGPDDFGLYINKNISLGHRRLSIIDLSKAGKQPMCNEDKTVWITYNGEIYNFKELRDKLIGLGHKFQSKTDTEVIVHGYEEWGEKVVEDLNGMFAFAIWDSNKEKLFLARDRLGIKPLYYYWDKNNDKFIFASEIKAVLKYRGISIELNEEILVDYLTFHNIMDDDSLFKGIKVLLPGHYMKFNNNKIEIANYWDAKFDKNKKSIEENLIKFRKIFRESVKRHLISDVPLGCYLSGGFDSCSVAVIASELIDSKLNTFTGAFDEGKYYDETPVSRAVAEKINARINEIFLKPNDFIDSINKIIYHLEEPRVGMAAFPMFHVSKLTSKQVKVILTGHGGDELFAGYPDYKGTFFRELLKKKFLNFPKLFKNFKLSEFSRIMYHLILPVFDNEIRVAGFILFNRKERRKLFTKRFYDKIKNYDPTKKVNKLLSGKKLSPFDKMQYLYLKTYLPSLFILEDKLGMASSIEARVPFCDNKLVEFSLSLPADQKLHNNELKFIVKECMKGKLPPIVYKQVKKGYPTPLAKWFKKDLKSFIYSILVSKEVESRGIFNVDYIKKLLDRHCSSKTDNIFDYVNATKIWSLLSIELWFRIFIDTAHEQ